jgi:leader peptidase (prepilin peptidase)/N-methyltransferase
VITGVGVWWLWQVFAILVSLVVGSFVTLCITRMPEDRSVVTPGSHCDMCGHAVRPYDNIPVVSWVVLRGKCRDCDGPIPVMLPLMELFVGCLGWLLFRKIVVDVDAIDVAHAVAWTVYFGFLCALTIAAFVDIRHRIIPDQTSSYAVPFGVLGCTLLAYLEYEGWPGFSVRQSVLGALVGYGFFAVLAKVMHALMGQEALGWGDVKLLAMIGAFVGVFPGIYFVLMFGSMMGAAFGVALTLYQWRRPSPPFGPPLALAATVYVFYGDLFIEAYMPMWSRFVGG